MYALSDISRLLRSTLRTKWLRGALIALLLTAQHGALTHALMHAGMAAQAQTAVHAQTALTDHGHDNPVRQASESCAFDLVYNQVLGGVHAGYHFDFAVAEHVRVVVTATAVRNPGTAVPYDSRGPPVFS